MYLVSAAKDPFKGYAAAWSLTNQAQQKLPRELVSQLQPGHAWPTRLSIEASIVKGGFRRASRNIKSPEAMILIGTHQKASPRIFTLVEPCTSAH